MIQGNIQERLTLAVVFIRQFPVLEFYSLVFRLKRYPHRVGAEGIFRCCTAVLAFLVGHNSSSILRNLGRSNRVRGRRAALKRSEERRVGKECRVGWWGGS